MQQEIGTTMVLFKIWREETPNQSFSFSCFGSMQKVRLVIHPQFFATFVVCSDLYTLREYFQFKVVNLDLTDFRRSS